MADGPLFLGMSGDGRDRVTSEKILVSKVQNVCDFFGQGQMELGIFCRPELLTCFTILLFVGVRDGKVDFTRRFIQRDTKELFEVLDRNCRTNS